MRFMRFLVCLTFKKATVEFAKLKPKKALVILFTMKEGDIFDGLHHTAFDHVLGDH